MTIKKLHARTYHEFVIEAQEAANLIAFALEVKGLAVPGVLRTYVEPASLSATEATMGGLRVCQLLPTPGDREDTRK